MGVQAGSTLPQGKTQTSHCDVTVCAVHTEVVNVVDGGVVEVGCAVAVEVLVALVDFGTPKRI